MQYVIERTLVRFGGEDDIVEDIALGTVDEAEVDIAYKEARPKKESLEFFWKVTLWEHYRSMAEAPASEGGCYRLLRYDGELVLRRCAKSLERRG